MPAHPPGVSVLCTMKSSPFSTLEVVCWVGEHQYQLAHWCSICEHFHAYTKCEIKHNGMWGWGSYGLDGWGIYGLNGWGSYDKVSYCFSEDMGLQQWWLHLCNGAQSTVRFTNGEVVTRHYTTAAKRETLKLILPTDCIHCRTQILWVISGESDETNNCRNHATSLAGSFLALGLHQESKGCLSS